MCLYEPRDPLGRSGEKYSSKINFKNIGRLFILLSEGENGITKWNFFPENGTVQFHKFMLSESSKVIKVDKALTGLMLMKWVMNWKEINIFVSSLTNLAYHYSTR